MEIYFDYSRVEQKQKHNKYILGVYMNFIFCKTTPKVLIWPAKRKSLKCFPLLKKCTLIKINIPKMELTFYEQMTVEIINCVYIFRVIFHFFKKIRASLFSKIIKLLFHRNKKKPSGPILHDTLIFLYLSLDKLWNNFEYIHQNIR